MEPSHFNKTLKYRIICVVDHTMGIFSAQFYGWKNNVVKLVIPSTCLASNSLNILILFLLLFYDSYQTFRAFVGGLSC